MKILLIDFSSIAHSVFHVLKADKTIQTEEEFKNLWKHSILNSILDKKHKIRPDKIILCLDTGKSWRNDYFKYYKAKRRLKKLENKEEYDFMIKLFNEFLEEIKNNLPWILIGVKNAEADDVIGVLTYHLKDHEVVILSNDKDFKQLLKLKNVKFYGYRSDKYEELDIDPKEFLLRQILNGDSADGIPNVRNIDEIFLSEKRQLPCGPKKIDKILENGIDEWIEENDLKKNYERNTTLIELSIKTIPEDIWNTVIDTHENYVMIEKDFMKILEFFRRSKLNLLQKRVNEFF